jgi:hypothetical protein
MHGTTVEISNKYLSFVRKIQLLHEDSHYVVG